MLPVKVNNHESNLLRYRLSRFFMSGISRFFTRIVLPLALISFVGYQIWLGANMGSQLRGLWDTLYRSVAYSPFFEIDQLAVDGNLAREDVLSVLGGELPVSYLEVDLDELRAELLKKDSVGDVSVRYNYQGRLAVLVSPRIPVALFYDGVRFSSIDKTGHLINPLSDRSERRDLFVLSGAGLDGVMIEAEKLIRLLTPIAGSVRGLERVGARRWDVVLVNGGRVMLPAREPIQAMRLVLEQHQSTKILNRRILAYDLRNPTRPIVRLLPADLVPDPAETDATTAPLVTLPQEVEGNTIQPTSEPKQDQAPMIDELIDPADLETPASDL